MQTSLTKKEQADLIKTFDDLPPNRCLSAFPSAKELHKFLERKGFWLSLQQALSNYFNGKPLLEEIIVEHPVGYALLEVKIDKYLALYNMLNWGWHDIQQAFNGTVMPGNTPGEIFAYILESEACSQFKNNTKPLDAQILYRGWCQYKKCLNSNTEKTQQEVAKLDKLLARLKRQRKKLGDEEGISEHIVLASLCLDACLESKKQLVKSKAKGYEEAKNNYIDMITKQLRRQNFDPNISQPIPTIYIIPEVYIT